MGSAHRPPACPGVRCLGRSLGWALVPGSPARRRVSPGRLAPLQRSRRGSGPEVEAARRAHQRARSCDRPGGVHRGERSRRGWAASPAGPSGLQVRRRGRGRGASSTASSQGCQGSVSLGPVRTARNGGAGERVGLCGGAGLGLGGAHPSRGGGRGAHARGAHRPAALDRGSADTPRIRGAEHPDPAYPSP